MIGHKIKRLRIQKGLTQQQLIDGLFDRSYISIIERGKVVPPVETLEILAQRLDVPLAELTNYSEAVMRARELLKVARKTQDINILRQVWEICVGVDAIEVMIECVLAWSDVQLGNANEYIELLEALNQTIYAMISVDEDFAEMTTLQFRRANTYYHLGMTDQAIIAYRALESQSISNEMLARIKISLGSALVKIMHHKEAYVKYREALEIREIPKILIARAHQGLGICCRYLKNWSDAQNHFRLAAELFSETDCDRYMQVQHALGVLWLDVFNFDQANEYFTKARDYYRRKKMALSEVELYEEYARAEFYKQHYEESNECCNRGLQLLDGLNAPLAGRFYLWRYRNYNAMHDKTREEEIWLVVKSLLGSQLKMVIDTLDPNMPPETRQALYAKMGYQYPLAQVHL